VQQRAWPKLRYSISSSARASSVGGNSIPSGFAVLRLIRMTTQRDALLAARFRGLRTVETKSTAGV
jgi:uncharacterized protein YecT (DUF1311 family)